MKPLKEYFSRIGKSRGFGIQSPWAYSFVRDVIFETLPYYAYSDIESHFSSLKEQKWQKLFYRLKNYASGDGFSLIDFCSTSDEDIRRRLEGKGENGMLVLRGVDKYYPRWVALERDADIGVSFDLYECVIIFAPQKGRNKQCYKLNF